MNTRFAILKFISTLAALAVLQTTVAADYVTTVLNTPNLLGYWRFDAVFRTNSLVHGYTGALHGQAQLSTPGTGCPLGTDPVNQALVLDGNNSSPSYLSTSLTGQITNQGSVLVWVYLTAQPSTLGHIFQITSQAQTGNDFDLQIQTDNRLYFFTDSGSSTVYSTSLPLNQWHFLAATFVANSTRAIYLDGQPVASSTAGGHAVNNSPLWIGNNLIFGPRCFAGMLDEVAVFNRALSAAEIAAINSAAVAPRLNIAKLTSGVRLTWSTNSPGYTLQTNASLNTAPWGTLTTNFGLFGANYAVTNSSSGSEMFYRLIHP